MMSFKKFYSIIAVLLCCLLTGCKDTVYTSSIKGYPVSLNINIAAEDPHFVTTNTTAYKTYTKKRFETDFLGFAGILIYIGLDAQYHAYDLGCPVCLLRDVPCMVDGIFAICPVCGEQYDVSYGIGNPTKGISPEPLCSYNVTFNGTVLTVRN